MTELLLHLVQRHLQTRAPLMPKVLRNPLGVACRPMMSVVFMTLQRRSPPQKVRTSRQAASAPFKGVHLLPVAVVKLHALRGLKS